MMTKTIAFRIDGEELHGDMTDAIQRLHGKPAGQGRLSDGTQVEYYAFPATSEIEADILARRCAARAAIVDEHYRRCAA